MSGATTNAEGVLRRKVMKALRDLDDAPDAAEVARLAGCGTQKAASVLEALMVKRLTEYIRIPDKGRVRRIWRLTAEGRRAAAAAAGETS